MSYFVIQVRTSGEAKYLKLAERAMEAAHLEASGNLFFPQRKLFIRRRGKKMISLLPLYPGYLFYKTETLSYDIYRLLRRVPGFFRFLSYSGSPEPLKGDDENLLLHFLSFGRVVETSQVTFDENKRIRILAGPMKGLEGRIVKVDRRKKRAKISLSLYENSFPIDFSFEEIEQVVPQA